MRRQVDTPVGCLRLGGHPGGAHKCLRIYPFGCWGSASEAQGPMEGFLGAAKLLLNKSIPL